MSKAKVNKKTRLYRAKNIRMPSAVFYDNALSEEARILYGVLLGRAGDLNRPFKDTHSWLAKVMGWKDQRVVRKYLDELIGKGYVREELRRQRGRVRYYDYYCISFKHFYDMDFRNKDNPEIEFVEYDPFEDDDHNGADVKDTIMERSCSSPYMHNHADNHNGINAPSGNYNVTDHVTKYVTKEHTQTSCLKNNLNNHSNSKTKNFFQPVLLNKNMTDKVHFMGIPRHIFADSVYESGYFSTMDCFYISRKKENKPYPLSTQILYSFEMILATAVFREDRASLKKYLPYYYDYLEEYQVAEQENRLDDLSEWVNKYLATKRRRNDEPEVHSSVVNEYM